MRNKLPCSIRRYVVLYVVTSSVTKTHRGLIQARSFGQRLSTFGEAMPRSAPVPDSLFHK